MGLGIFDDLGRLGFGDFKPVDPAHAFAFGVHLKHDPYRLFLIFAEKPAQNVDHKIHRRVVVIQNNDLVLPRFLQFRFGRSNRDPMLFVFLCQWQILTTHIVKLSSVCNREEA